ncbi:MULTISPECIES: hypothetical protein [Cronobacter]|uniref:hypothetical protein n=1 Tax=Cronobacter TaxID=413496 RepID=UPI00100DA049|nr:MULTISPECIES: hypothetical protein [Cronobacter]NUW57587.1 hypothetical protein [Cronobacter turicensis]
MMYEASSGINKKASKVTFQLTNEAICTRDKINISSCPLKGKKKMAVNRMFESFDVTTPEA